MSEFAQYPYQALQAVGSNLTGISDQLGSKAKDAFQIAGFTQDQDRINQALGDFQSEWEQSVNKLGENIGGFGDISNRIGTMAAQFDAELAKSMNPGGRGGSAGPGGAI